MFRPEAGDDTKLAHDETIFPIREDVRKPGLVTDAATKRRAAKAQ
jgi:hypothetical protein